MAEQERQPKPQKLPEGVVLQQRNFILTTDQWKIVNKAFDCPAKKLPNLERILSEADEWDDEVD